MYTINDEISEIKEIAMLGMEKMIIQGDNEIKELFFKILVKSEIILNNYEKIPSVNNISLNNTSNSNNRTRDSIPLNIKDNIIIIAYCFSEYEHTCLYPNISQQDAFEKASKILGVKKNTLSNFRDSFDGHNNSHRKGWQAPLAPDLQRIKLELSNLSKESILEKARNILGV